MGRATELSAHARELYVDPDNEVYLSSVSVWEMTVKYMLGRLPLPEPPERFVLLNGNCTTSDPLQLDEETALHLTRLPPLHKDPFDRMLVCQAIIHHLVILTPDDLVNQYSVRTMW